MQEKNQNILLLRSKNDLVDWLKDNLPNPLEFIETNGASYQSDIRELEYCSRPLWAIFSLLANDNPKYEKMIEPYIKRIKLGLSPKQLKAFPKVTTKTRQIAVEMAVYGYGLLACKDKLLRRLSKNEIRQLELWLNGVNEIEIPIGNWLFFLLIINYGLKVNHLNYSQTKIDYALENIESLYIDNGWYFDGTYSQKDYYISFAFHFYSHLIKKFYPNFPLDVSQRSRLFEKDFIYWFDKKGRSLPFGRSLTYRFAHSSFWSACAISQIHDLDLPSLKSLIFDNLNFWVNQKDILSIGYAYPNLILSEDYNANGSPMWALKTFIILSLPDDDNFWKIKAERNITLKELHSSKESGFLFCRGEFHNYALSASQFSKNNILQYMSKYGKFCYSTEFGFNLTRNTTGITDFAIDSCLALSVSKSNQYFSRGKILKSAVYDDYVYSQWEYGDIAVIDSFLIPVNSQCHIRIHQINSSYYLETYEGAFPVFAWNAKFDDSINVDQGIQIKKNNMQSAIVDLIGNRDPIVISQNPNTNIYSYEKNAIPCLYTENNPKILACVVYGCVNEEINFVKVCIDKNKVILDSKIIILKEL